MRIPALALIVAALAAVAAGACGWQAIVAAGSLPCGAKPEAEIIAKWMLAALACQGGIFTVIVLGALLGKPRRQTLTPATTRATRSRQG